MSGYKLRKTFGLICLAVAGLLLLKEISGLAAPGVAEMAKKGFGEPLRDLLICFAIGGSGLYLYRDKTSDPSLFIWKLNIFALSCLDPAPEYSNCTKIDPGIWTSRLLL